MKRIFVMLLCCIACVATAARAQAIVSGSVQLTVNDASCTTANPCTLQTYRAVATAANIAAISCPALATPNIYTELATATLGTTITATSTQWVYSDALTNIAAGTAYCYQVTVTYSAGGPPSGTLGGLLMTIPYPIPAVPTSVSGTWIPGL